MNSIFTITTIRPDHANRCVGWYSDIQKAMQTVIHNDGDISEVGYYPYCVIEEIPRGIYQHPVNEVWFEWTGGCYVQIPKPERYRKPFNSVNFGMG